MRPTDNLLTIAEGARVSMSGLGYKRGVLSAISTFVIRAAIKEDETHAGEEGHAYGDSDRAKLLSAFAEHAPLGFLVALPEIIEDNPAGFCDEDEFETCVSETLSRMPLKHSMQLESVLADGNESHLGAICLGDFCSAWELH
jgi:hypothetical protein